MVPHGLVDFSGKSLARFYSNIRRYFQINFATAAEMQGQRYRAWTMIAVEYLLESFEVLAIDTVRLQLDPGPGCIFVPCLL